MEKQNAMFIKFNEELINVNHIRRVKRIGTSIKCSFIDETSSVMKFANEQSAKKELEQFETMLHNRDELYEFDTV